MQSLIVGVFFILIILFNLKLIIAYSIIAHYVSRDKNVTHKIKQRIV